MMIDWKAIVALIVTPAAVVGIVAWFAKAIVEQSLKNLFARSLVELKAEKQKDLAEFKNDAQRRLASLEADLEARGAVAAERRATARDRDERVRIALVQVAAPTRDAIDGLLRRLENILRDELHSALGDTYLQATGWSMTHRHALESTMYAFAKYFALRTRICGVLADEVFNAKGEREAFVKQLYVATQPLSRWPLAGLEASGPLEDDAQVFTLEQDAVGGMMTLRDGGNARTLEYSEFLHALNDPVNKHLKNALEPLETLLKQTRPKTRIWGRLELFEAALKDLRKDCDQALQQKPTRAKGAPEEAIIARS